MGYTSYESAFHQLLTKHLNELIVDKSMSLGNGEARKASDLSATGIAYLTEAAYIKALRDVIAASDDIAKQMMKAG